MLCVVRFLKSAGVAGSGSWDLKTIPVVTVSNSKSTGIPNPHTNCDTPKSKNKIQ